MKFLTSLLFYFAVVLVPLSAKFVQVPGENITLDVPDAWVPAKQAQVPYIYLATDPEHRSIVGLAKLPNPKGHEVTPLFIAATKKGMIESAAKAGEATEVKSENALTVSGAPAYLFTTESLVAGKKVEASNYVIATHDFYYLLSVQTSDFSKAPELQAIANSFHFTVMPAKPNNESDDGSAAYRAGRMVGYALPLLVLAIIVRIIVRKARQKP